MGTTIIENGPSILLDYIVRNNGVIVTGNCPIGCQRPCCTKVQTYNNVPQNNIYRQQQNPNQNYQRPIQNNQTVPQNNIPQQQVPLSENIAEGFFL